MEAEAAEEVEGSRGGAAAAKAGVGAATEGGGGRCGRGGGGGGGEGEDGGDVEPGAGLRWARGLRLRGLGRARLGRARRRQQARPRVDRRGLGRCGGLGRGGRRGRRGGEPGRERPPALAHHLDLVLQHRAEEQQAAEVRRHRARGQLGSVGPLAVRGLGAARPDPQPAAVAALVVPAYGEGEARRVERARRGISAGGRDLGGAHPSLR